MAITTKVPPDRLFDFSDVGDGKAGRAECGHPGVATFGHFYQCRYRCETAAPVYVPPEKTQKICDHYGREGGNISTYARYDPKSRRTAVYCAKCEELLGHR